MNRFENSITKNSNDLQKKRIDNTFNNILDGYKQDVHDIVASTDNNGSIAGGVKSFKKRSNLSESEKNDLRAIANGEKQITEEKKENKTDTIEDIVGLIQENVKGFEEIFKISGEQQDLESAQYWKNLAEEIKTPEGRERVSAFVGSLIVDQTKLLEEVNDLEVSIDLRESIENKKKIQALLKREIKEKPLTQEELPTDSKGLFRYFVLNFKDIYSIEDGNQFLAKFNPEVCQKYLTWFRSKIAAMIREVPEGVRYPDTVASVLGNGGHELTMFQGVMALKDGHITNITDEFLKTPFSKLAKRYLDWDLGDDYFKAFSKRD